MADSDQPQIYLITPPDLSPDSFPKLLDRMLGDHEIACVRLALASQDADKIARAADGVRAICHDHDVALVIADHVALVERLGLDGVHLTDGSRNVRKAREDLGKDSIVGAFAGTSRHDGMTAGEVGADYIAFGPVRDSGLGQETVDQDVLTWWSEMIELPVVAEGGFDPETVARLAPVCDFLAFGAEIWDTDDPEAALDALIAGLP